MDGLSPNALLLPASPLREAGFPHGGLQHTLKAPIGCVGVAVHSGRRVSLTLCPASAGTGIVFRRTDLLPPVDIPARFDLVSDTRLCTVISSPDNPQHSASHSASHSVSTVEHLMAALAGAGVDNARIEVDGPELPILDGSSAPFLFLIDCAGVVAQAASRGRIEVLRPVRVRNGEAFAELLPPAGEGGATLDMSLSIDFDAPAIGRQALSLSLTEDSFRTELAEARTFALAQDVARLHEAGLARGGSLDNAVLVDGAKVLNPAGLRMADEFVRHKLLDAVGDLALAGAPIVGRFVAHRSGHTLNNRVLRALFADATAWRRVDTTADWTRAEAAFVAPARASSEKALSAA